MSASDPNSASVALPRGQTLACGLNTASTDCMEHTKTINIEKLAEETTDKIADAICRSSFDNNHDIEEPILAALKQVSTSAMKVNVALLKACNGLLSEMQHGQNVPSISILELIRVAVARAEGKPFLPEGK